MTIDATPDLQDRIRILVAGDRRCEREIAASRVTASLYLLRHAIDDAAPIEIRDQRFVDAQDAVKWALGCNPLDGNLWLVAGMLDRVAVYQPDRFHDLMAMSIKAGPYEGNLLERRWTLLAPLVSGQTIPIYDNILATNLGSLLKFARPKETAQILAMIRSSGGASVAEAELHNVSEKRREELQVAAATAAKQPSAVSGKPEDFRINPFGTTP